MDARLDLGPSGRRLRWLFVAAGGLALTVQVVLLRELIVALQGDETAVGLGLGAWLAGIALGAWVARRLMRRVQPERWTTACIGLLGLAGPAGIVVSRLLRLAVAPAPGELLSLGPALVLAVSVLAPPGALIGISFAAMAAWAVRAGWSPGKGVADLYVLESAGALVGGLTASFVVIPFCTPFAGSALAGAFWSLVGWLALRARASAGRIALPAIAAALVLVGLPPLAGPIEESTLRARFRGLVPGIPLVAWTDTPYQHLAIAGREPHHLYKGGQYAGSFPDATEHENLAHRLASLAPRPARVLLVGGAVHGALRFLLQHPVDEVVVVTIDRRDLPFVRGFLAPEDRRALDDPRVRLVTDDPRRFLARDRERYGLIIVLEPSPVTLLLARYSTAEFYRSCAERLAPDGVFVTTLTTAPNVLTPEMAAMAGAMFGAMREAFPLVHATPGPDGLLVAGLDPVAVSLDAGVLARRFRERGIRSDVFAPELFPILLPRDRIDEQERVLRDASLTVPASRDERPVSFLHALALRQRLAGSVLAPVLMRAARASPWQLAALAVFPSLVVLTRVAARRRRLVRNLDLAAVHAVAITGACGMTWSLLILFSYQTRVGALYGQIGWLTATFMFGLAAGGRLMISGAESPLATARRRLLAVTAAATLFAVAVPIALRGFGSLLPGAAALPPVFHGVILLCAGGVTGALFPVAAGALLAARRDAAVTAGTLWWADHLGAAAAALVASIVFVPALGLYGTGWVLVALEGLALAIGILAVGFRPLTEADA
jgi:spermidine synthase